MYFILSIFIYYLYILSEYIFHYLGHIRHKYNVIYLLHITHHKKYYPINNFESEKYRSNNEGVVAYVPLYILLIGILYHIFEYRYWIFIIIQSTLHTYINNYIHQNIHLKNSWLTRYEWFRKAKQLHYKHHQNWDKNYSFGIDHTIDKINKTYKS